MNRKFFYAFVGACLASASAQGEPLLHWEEVRKIARERNPTLGAAGLGKEASVAAVKESYSGFLPRVSLNAERSRSATELANIDSKRTDIRYGATATLNLFNGFASKAALNKAQAGEGAAEASYDVSSASLRRQLRVAYFNIYIQQERIRLNERALKREDQNQRLVEIKYKSGSEARWNVKKTSAELERARYNLNSAKAQLESSREALASLLLLDKIPDQPVAAPEKLSPPEADSAATLVANHPQLVKSKFTAESASEDRTIARSGFFPTLDLSYSRSLNDSRPDLGAATRSNSHVFSVTANWNIFNGAADYYRVQQANINFEAAELNTAGAQRSLASTYRTNAVNYKLAEDQLPVSRALREAADEREKTVSEQYRAGLKNYLEWEQAESQLLDAEQAEIKALSESLTAYADLEQALGLTLEQP